MIFLKHKRKVVQALEDSELERLLVDAHEAHVKLRDIRTLIKKATQLLKQKVSELALGLGTWSFEVEGRGIKVIRRQEVAITDVEGLKGILGKDFSDFVDVEVVYKPRKALMELLADGDSELAQSIREKVSMKIKTEVRWS